MNQNRRQFIATTALGVAGGALFHGDLLAAEDPYRGFKVGAQSYSLRHFKLDGCIERMQTLGLHYVEFFQGHFGLTADLEKIAEVKEKLAKAEITALAWGVEGFGGNEAENRRRFEFAKLLGIKAISADPSPESFASLDKLVEEYGIAIAIHNHGPGARFAKISSVAKAIEGHHKLIGACVDTGHYLRSDEDPVKAVQTFGERTHGVHVKDVTLPDHKFCILGKGALDSVALFRELKKLKYSNCISLEYEESESNPVPDMTECLKVVRESIAKI